MRLKHIKLAGFKSFVDATTVPFPDQMTAIVGPNGCGKSNVIDAVRWVLGESSAKNLRGDAMTDVIFNGSSNRKPVSQASVELVFDNAQGRIEGNLADRAEISVKRQVNKDGQSLYFLNGSKCRRRDITDIFLGTGLGPRSYAIIEQGMISRLIESKPQELRVFIEEAAGISKYKERRRETENRIKHTRDNLDRLQDVREELGTQLEKLKRQSATAKRFKDLKAKERTLKAELYALKWHKYNQQLNLYEQEQREKQAKLEAFIAEQRGGELGMLKLKEQQQEFSDKAQQAQQKVFQIANQITRLEQQIVFSSENRQRQQDELEQLTRTTEDAEQHLELEQERLTQLTEEIELVEPEHEMVIEQLELGQEELLSAEQEYEDWQNLWERQQKVAAQSQQSAQVLQTKIQGLETSLSRMKQRLMDLQREMSDVDDVRLIGQIEQLESTALNLQQAHEKAKEDASEKEQKHHQAQLKLSQDAEEYQLSYNQWQSTKAKLDSLQQWQIEYDEAQKAFAEKSLQGQEVDIKGPVVSQLKVSAQWQQSVETLLSHLGNPLLLAQLPSQPVSGSFVSANQVAPTPGSIAEQIEHGAYPDWFNLVAAANSIEQGQDWLANGGMSAITEGGVWFGSNWQILGGMAQGDDSQVLKRLEQIEALTKNELEMSQEVEQTLSIKFDSEQVLNQLKLDLQTATEKAQEQSQSLQEAQLQLKLLQQQRLQNQTLLQRLEAESETLQEQIELEQEHLFQLQDEVELSQEQSIEFESKLEELELQKQDLLRQVSTAKQQFEAIKSKSHQIDLKQQTLSSQLQGVNQNVSRGKQHLQQLINKQSQLQEALTSQEDPSEQLQESLEIQLHEKLEAEQTLIEQQNLLSEVLIKISELEQGQSGVMAKLDSMRSDIESIKLDCEGARIRAQNMLETLNEMQQPLKPVLETMPAEAEEETWALQLEKTTNSISRLGAINLAAIDEYEVQAERKGYLDAQNDDLTGALETLESAIRKIDRESRTKFKETYEQVNADLQHLFPKVFGGGSAYLELTADDLLETGVTIMARPPGKKNSTIHLLSGGEKALTALSLVFSIFRLNPAPFCMLDEVDAPLDDANVGRFCNLVKEMSETVQFIYISHNKVAMEMATHLTGVTMQEPGVSRLVAVDIQEAVKMAQAS